MPRIYDDALTRGIKMRDYILAIFKKQGRDLTKCELCGAEIETPILHHEKYDGATINDIKIVCQKCNTKKENKKLE